MNFDETCVAVYLYENGRCSRLYARTASKLDSLHIKVSRSPASNPYGESYIENYRAVFSALEWEEEDELVAAHVGLACEDLIRKEQITE